MANVTVPTNPSTTNNTLTVNFTTDVNNITDVQLTKDGNNYISATSFTNTSATFDVSSWSNGTYSICYLKIIYTEKSIPTANKPFILLDGGANNDCRPEMLVQFAIMGSAYMNRVMGIEKPVVKLLNVGAEETKGRELDLEAYKLLEKAPVNFCGNIEARELPFGKADVVVADGFTGNIALKLYEGMGKFMASELKNNIFAGTGKLAALICLGKIKKLSRKLDYKSVGGALMIGASKPVIKAHGSSDAKAFYNAIRQARDCVKGNMIAAIAETVCGIQKG